MANHVPIPDLSEATIARFEEKIDRSGDCHLWTAHVDKRGCGRLGVKHWSFLAPRIAYKLATGRDPKEMCVCHRCDNPRCVNPDHLFLGTHADNMRDRDAKGRVARGDNTGANRQGSGKLNEVKVIKIKRALARGERPTDLARQYDVGVGQISSIKHGYKWRWLNVL